MTRPARRLRVVVVGSGIAGLTTALHAAAAHDVMLVSAGSLGAGNTAYAQGGIAGVVEDGGRASSDGPRLVRDSIDAHVADTIRAGAGLCDAEAVRILCSEAPERLRELIALGVPFDRVGGQLQRALEGAHSAPRVLHAGGDATGAAIARALVAAARARLDEVREGTRLVDVVLRDDVVVGAVLDAPGGRTTLAADAVVLATGGFAGLYAHTSNPASADGAGIAVAARAGAVLADLEFVQFHPTVLPDGGGFLVSEAVRGEGAVLRDAHGERFMPGLHSDGDLAPRDVVAGAIARVMREQGGRPVYLDATGIGGDRLDARFPSIAAHVRAAGLDWGREPVPVTPAAHYTMGGVATDLDGRTTVPGLFAVGEVARTGVHGANRLASNSLLEGAVFGARVARALSDGVGRGSLSDEGAAAVTFPQGSAAVPDVPSTSTSSSSASALGRVLWDDVGIVRSGEGLTRAVGTVTTLSAVDAGDQRDALTVAALVAGSALLRRETRGAHARSDHPVADPAARSTLVRGVPTGRGGTADPPPIGANTDPEELIAC